MKTPHPILESIGLTKKEAEIYEILLRLGDSPVADILEATGSHPQVVYRALDSLTAKGLVIPSQRKHRKYVRAEDPHLLEKLEEKKLADLRQSLPDLLALQKTSKDAIVRVARGNEAVRDLRRRAADELQAGEIFYILGASTPFYDAIGPYYHEIERKRIRKKIYKKLIAYSSQRAQVSQDKYQKLAEFRYLPEDYPMPSIKNFFRNTVALVMWTAEPIVITIESPEIAESYRHFFDSLWAISKP